MKVFHINVYEKQQIHTIRIFRIVKLISVEVRMIMLSLRM